MSQRTVIDCDTCGATDIEDETILVAIGSEFNGVETVTDWRSLHLCGSCARRELQRLLVAMGYEDARKWWDRLTIQRQR